MGSTAAFLQYHLRHTVGKTSPISSVETAGELLNLLTTITRTIFVTEGAMEKCHSADIGRVIIVSNFKSSLFAFTKDLERKFKFFNWLQDEVEEGGTT